MVYKCFSVMTQLFHEAKDVVLFNNMKVSWMEHFIFHRMKYLFHYINEKTFIICLYRDSNFQTNLKEISNKKTTYLRQNIIRAAHPTLLGKYYTDTCITLNTHTVPAALSCIRVSHALFLVILVLGANIWKINFALLPAQTQCNKMFCHPMP